MTTAEQTTPERSFSVEEQIISAAKRSTEALLTYTYTDVEQQLRAAEALTTGEFRRRYREFVESAVIPGSREKRTSTNAVVVGAGIQYLLAGDAKVLVFVDQSTTSADATDAKKATSSVLLRLQRVNDEWLISQFDPV